MHGKIAVKAQRKLLTPANGGGLEEKVLPDRVRGTSALCHFEHAMANGMDLRALALDQPRIDAEIDDTADDARLAADSETGDRRCRATDAELLILGYHFSFTLLCRRHCKHDRQSAEIDLVRHQKVFPFH